MAELMVQDSDGRRAYRARVQRTIEVDYHDRLGRFGIEAVDVNGRTVVLYLSMIEACGLSAALRSEIGAASDAIQERAERGGKCGNGRASVRYNTERR